MLLQSSQQAWIRGLTGLDKEGGISVSTLPFQLPTPGNHFLKVTLYGSSELISYLLLLCENRTKLCQLSITNRIDTTKELDKQIQMALAEAGMAVKPKNEEEKTARDRVKKAFDEEGLGE